MRGQRLGGSRRLEVKIDRTPPKVTAKKTRFRVFATLRATDETSGVASIEYRYRVRFGHRTSVTAWATYTGGFVFAGASSRVVLQFRATDNAGNVSEIGTLHKRK